jgi:hypothetical protein
MSFASAGGGFYNMRRNDQAWCHPNAGAHLLLEAGATQERRLLAVRCSAVLGRRALSPAHTSVQTIHTEWESAPYTIRESVVTIGVP